MKYGRKIILSLLCFSSVTYAASLVDQRIALHFMIIQNTQPDHTTAVIYDTNRADWLLDVQIGKLLSTSTNPEKTLTTYMGDVQSTIRQNRRNQQNLREKYATAMRQYNLCASEKRASDRDFFLWVRQGMDDKSLETISSASATAGACAEKARVKARAYKIMNQKILTSTRKLEKRLSLLRSNEAFILRNLDLIETSPKTIIQVNRLMKQLH